MYSKLKAKNKKLKKYSGSAIAIVTVIIILGLLSQTNLTKHLSRVMNFDGALAASNATLSLGNTKTATLGSELRIPVLITANGAVAGVDLDVLFDFSQLTLTDIVFPSQTAFKQALPISQNQFDKSNVLQSANNTGKIKYSLLAYDPSIQKVIDTGNTLNNTQISEFVFVTKKAGPSTIVFNHQLGNSTDSNVASLLTNQDALQNTQSVNINVTVQPTSTPTVSQSPTIQPSATPTLRPTSTPTIRPTSTPTPTPTLRPTSTPTNRPTATPSRSPSFTSTPTPQPSNNQNTNTGLRFDGVNDYVQISQNLPYLETFTVETIISPAKRNATGLIVSAADDNNGWSLEMLNGRAIFWVASPNGTWSSLSNSTVMPLNSWNHLAAVYNKGRVELYVNGKLNNAVKQMTSNYKPGTLFQYGGLRRYPFIAATIDSVKISKSAAYQSDFSAPSFLTPQSTDTIILHQLNESNGQTIINSVNSQTYSGTLGSSTNQDSADPLWLIVRR